jgi:hypothetical protein
VGPPIEVHGLHPRDDFRFPRRADYFECGRTILHGPPLENPKRQTSNPQKNSKVEISNWKLVIFWNFGALEF